MSEEQAAFAKAQIANGLEAWPVESDGRYKWPWQDSVFQGFVMGLRYGLQLHPSAVDARAAEFPRDELRRLIRAHFNEEAQASLIFTAWKDGIDIQRTTYAVEALADAIYQAALTHSGPGLTDKEQQFVANLRNFTGTNSAIILHLLIILDRLTGGEREREG